jgi:hypothetical protein
MGFCLSTRGSTIPTEFFFGSFGELGEWLRTNELNKAYVGGGGGGFGPP